MADIFLNLVNFAPHALLTLVPPSGYSFNLIKVSKDEHISFHLKYLDLHFKENLKRKTSFLKKKKKHFPRVSLL